MAQQCCCRGVGAAAGPRGTLGPSLGAGSSHPPVPLAAWIKLKAVRCSVRCLAVEGTTQQDASLARTETRTASTSSRQFLPESDNLAQNRDVANAVAPIRRRLGNRRGSAHGGDASSSSGRSRWPDLLLEKYAMGAQIGVGTFGTVYHGFDRKTGEEVAVKVIPSKDLRGGRGTRGHGLVQADRCAREAAVLADLQSCPSVVSLRWAARLEGCTYLVMEHCAGGDLEELLKETGPLSEAESAAVLRQCLNVVAACHARGVVHGDIKPANFLMVSSNTPRDEGADTEPVVKSLQLRAADFGSSQHLDSSSRGLSRRSGTPVFMAPEVLKRDYGCQADMWSVGIMMYNLITGRFPWWDSIEGLEACSMDEVCTAVLTLQIPTDYGPWLTMSPEGLDLLNRLLTSSPDDRLTAKEALAHPWFDLHSGGAESSASGAGAGETVPVWSATMEVPRVIEINIEV